MKKTIKILGWSLGGVLAAIAIVLAVLSSVFELASLDIVALVCFALCVVIEIAASILEIEPKRKEDEDA